MICDYCKTPIQNINEGYVLWHKDAGNPFELADPKEFKILAERIRHAIAERSNLLVEALPFHANDRDEQDCALSVCEDVKAFFDSQEFCETYIVDIPDGGYRAYALSLAIIAPREFDRLQREIANVVNKACFDDCPLQVSVEFRMTKSFSLNA